MVSVGRPTTSPRRKRSTTSATTRSELGTGISADHESMTVVGAGDTAALDFESVDGATSDSPPLAVDGDPSVTGTARTTGPAATLELSSSEGPETLALLALRGRSELASTEGSGLLSTVAVATAAPLTMLAMVVECAERSARVETCRSLRAHASIHLSNAPTVAAGD